MPAETSSSPFTQVGAEPFGPPLIGALLRAPWEAVRRRMLERLREHGFDDLDAAHLNVFLYPGPQGARPSELAARLRISKQALNYLLGQLERLGYLERQADPRDTRSRRIALTPRGVLAGQKMRDAVSEIEHDWEQQLGPKRFAQLGQLLRELGDSTETRQATSDSGRPGL
jgi:DNA-binding MarR family transcriptional regulator